MTQEYQLRILPEIAANEQRLKEYISKEKGINLRNITATRILKRSIDARQRTIFVNLKVRAYQSRCRSRRTVCRLTPHRTRTTSGYRRTGKRCARTEKGSGTNQQRTYHKSGIEL